MGKLCVLFVLAAFAVVARGIRIDPPKLTRIGKYFADDDQARITVDDPVCRKGNGLYPHPNDCTQYLACRDGVSQVRTCPEGFKFDSRRHCTPDVDADCGKPRGTKVKIPSSSAALTCPEQYGEFPYPGDCRKYITCDDWNPTSWMCNGEQVYEQGVGCWDGGVCRDSEPQQAQASSALTCPEQYGQFPYPGDCRKYITCDDWNPTSWMCNGEQVFEQGVGCVDGGVCRDSEPQQAQATLTCPEQYGQFPYPGDCRKYITCDDWNPTSWMCNGEQVYEQGVGCWDGGVCRDSEPQQARASSALTCPEQYGQFPYPGDCRKYITCDDWNPTSWMCNGEQVYEQGVGCWDGGVCRDSEPQQAQVSDAPKCPESYGYFPYMEDCHKFLVCVDGVPTVHTCPEGSVYKDNVGCVEGDVCPKQAEYEDSQVTCRKANAVYPHERCDWYYQCVAFRPYIKFCPKDTAFDPKKEKCTKAMYNKCMKKNDLQDIMRE